MAAAHPMRASRPWQSTGNKPMFGATSRQARLELRHHGPRAQDLDAGEPAVLVGVEVDFHLVVYRHGLRLPPDAGALRRDARRLEVEVGRVGEIVVGPFLDLDLAQLVDDVATPDAQERRLGIAHEVGQRLRERGGGHQWLFWPGGATKAPDSSLRMRPVFSSAPKS